MAETQAVMATNTKIRILFIISYKKVVMNSEKGNGSLSEERRSLPFPSIVIITFSRNE
jgi:hypothetical protein